MKINTIKTHKITDKDKSIFKILDKYVKSFDEKSILVVSSKIVSICEGSIVSKNKIDRQKLAEIESDLYLPKYLNKYGFTFTIKNNIIIASAGIDESNAFGQLILWPLNPQKSANKIREYICKKFKLKNVGVIITDSKVSPLRWGVTGIAVSHSGFAALNDYVGKKDLFGRKFKVEKTNVADGLAASAVVVMGEGSEQTPLSVIEDIPFVQFQSRNPTKKELDFLKISLTDDLFSSFLKGVPWKKGGNKKD